VAVYGVLSRPGAVLFLRRAGTGYRDGQLTLPAGHLDGGEAAAAGLARELAEELGIRVDPGACTLVLVVHRAPEFAGDREYVDLVFSVAAWEGTPRNAEPAKASEVVWADPDALGADVLPHLPAVLAAIAGGERLLTVGFDAAPDVR